MNYLKVLMDKFHNKTRRIAPLIALVSLIVGNWVLFFSVFLLTSFQYKSFSTGVLMACIVSCEKADIESSDACNKGGFTNIYYAFYEEVDWDTMLTDPTAFDPTTQTILSYIMLGGATFKKLTSDRKQGTYNFLYTEDTQLYTQLIQLIFEGKSAANRNAFSKMLCCRNMIFHILDNNCLERVVGVEYNGTVFNKQVKTMRVIRHLDEGGRLSEGSARDELDIGGESLFPPLYSTVGETNIPY